MVTDGILSAVQGMTDRFDTTGAKSAGKAIPEMPADFDEDAWKKLTNPYAVDAWLSQYIRKSILRALPCLYTENGLLQKSISCVRDQYRMGQVCRKLLGEME